MLKALENLGIYFDSINILNDSFDNGFIDYDEFLEMTELNEAIYLQSFR